jgi:hypothetical protein
MYCIYLCENRAMKPVEIIFSERMVMRENDGEDESNGDYCKQIQCDLYKIQYVQCDNETPLYN